MVTMVRIQQDRLNDRIIVYLPFIGVCFYLNFEGWVQNVENNQLILQFMILCLCYAKSNGFMTNMLENWAPTWKWLQVKKYLHLHFSNTVTKAPATFAILVECQGTNENI